MDVTDPVTTPAPPGSVSAGSHSSNVDDTVSCAQEAADAPDPVRRAMLTGLLAASAASVLPPAFTVPSAHAAEDAFLSASKILTGRSSLDPADGARLYAALTADDPHFAAGIQSLFAILDGRSIDLSQLQHVLDSEHSPVAALPRKIVTAWYTGIVGEGEKARCITYETALMNVVVADKLRPPSYCFGAPGSWVEKPV